MLFRIAFFVLSLQIITKAKAAVIVRNETVSGGGSINLVRLGTIEGKTYYADRSEDRTFMEATTYCHSVGLQLGTIQTENEALFLKLSYDHDYFISLYWTAARDSQKPRALSWDNTGTEPGALTSIRWRNTVREYQICAAFSSWPTPGQYRVMLPCSAPIGTLCQGL